MFGSYTHPEPRETIPECRSGDGGFDFKSVLDLVSARIDNLAVHSAEYDFQGANKRIDN
jgi:hypothetical protein